MEIVARIPLYTWSDLIVHDNSDNMNEKIYCVNQNEILKGCICFSNKPHNVAESQHFKPTVIKDFELHVLKCLNFYKFNSSIVLMRFYACISYNNHSVNFCQTDQWQLAKQL